MIASPHASQEWEGGLDAVLPPRERMPANVAQPYAEQARAAAAMHQARGGSEDAMWDGAGDVQPRGDFRGPPRHGGRTEAWGDDNMAPEDPMAMSRRRDKGGGRSAPPDRPDLFGRREPEWDDMPPRDDRRRFEAENGFGDDLRSRRREPDPRAMNFEDMPIGNKAEVEENFVAERRDAGRGGRNDPRDFRDAPRQGGDWEDVPVGSQQATAAAFSVNFDGCAGGRGGGGGFSGVPDDDAFPARQPPPRARPKAPPADDCWAGQSLGDALGGAKKASPPAAASSAPRGGGGSAGRGRAPSPVGAGADCTKSPQEIITWVRSLPESHVPEKTREQLAAIVEDRCLNGVQFTAFVKTVPPEVCAPKNAMKLKAAWTNVLKEAEARQVALANLSNAPKQKATMIVV